MSPAKKPADRDDDESLKRLGGGRWQTRDARFTIEPESGTWAVVDDEATDDLGLPLVRGPYRSLTEAKAAIAEARSGGPVASPLAERLEARKGAAAPKSPKRTERPARADDADAASGRAPGDAAAKTDRVPAREPKPTPASRSQTRTKTPPKPEDPEEPAWLHDLAPAERGRARRLIDQLTAEGATDAESIVRRDLVGEVPAVAAHAIARRLAALPEDTSPQSVAELLASGRDERLAVRWRIVDGDGRPIMISTPRPVRRRD